MDGEAVAAWIEASSSRKTDCPVSIQRLISAKTLPIVKCSIPVFLSEHRVGEVVLEFGNRHAERYAFSESHERSLSRVPSLLRPISVKCRDRGLI